MMGPQFPKRLVFQNWDLSCWDIWISVAGSVTVLRLRVLDSWLLRLLSPWPPSSEERLHCGWFVFGSFAHLGSVPACFLELCRPPSVAAATLC